MFKQAFFSVGELARLTGINRWRMARMLTSQKIPISRVGRRRLVYLTVLTERAPDLMRSISALASLRDAEAQSTTIQPVTNPASP